MQITFDISNIDYVHADKVVLLLKWLRGGDRAMPFNLARHLELIEWLEDVHDDIEKNLDNYDWSNSTYEPNTKIRRYSIRAKEVVEPNGWMSRLLKEKKFDVRGEGEYKILSGNERRAMRSLVRQKYQSSLTPIELYDNLNQFLLMGADPTEIRNYGKKSVEASLSALKKLFPEDFVS